jgi:superfamily II DNA or RNA helicase
MWFKYNYHSEVVSCDIIEAIEDDILPEPEIVLWPLTLETTRKTETLIINPKIKSPVVEVDYKDRWKYKEQKNIRAIVHCTQQQKMLELNSQIDWMKNLYMRTRSKQKEQSWLYLCGKRLEFLADCKLQIVKLLLRKLKNSRTITFCKTIKQSEVLGLNCIHSQNKDAEKVYESFNKKKIKHITAVNILNENANLVDCKYAIFNNLTSSEVMQVQRLGRSMRHKSPVIIIPFYKGTREEEIVTKMFQDYNKDFIKIKSLDKL